MGHPLSTRTIGRTAVVGLYVAVLAVAGRPVGLAVALGVLLVALWAAPLLLSPARYRAVAPVAVPPPVPVADPEEPGPA
jgi:hypothetical protein